MGGDGVNDRGSIMTEHRITAAGEGSTPHGAGPRRVRSLPRAFVLLCLHLSLLSASGIFPAAGVAGAQARQETASPAPQVAKSIIVKYRAEGDHALEQCADRISSQRDRFARHSRDGSDSLDQIQQRFALGRQRAIFRAPSSEPLEVQRRTLRGRLERQRPSPRSARRAPTSGRRLPDLAHVYRIEIPEGVSRSELLDALSSDPHVEYAQPDHLRVLDQALPFDDPFLESIGSWGQPYPDLWGPERVGVVEIWPELQGEGAVVAIVDTGLDRFHPDIAANVWVNPGEDLDGDGLAEPEDANGLDDDGNGFVDDLTGFDFANSVDVDEDGFFDGPNDVSDPDPFDDHGHGTHVAGTIAAVADNGIGIVGIAPRAKVMALKGFPEEGPASDSILWRAVLYAAENGATVANNSWSCGSPCPDNPLADEVLEIVEALGMVVVTSAGNASDDVVFRSPENGRRVITVGATGVDDQPASFTNGGWLMDVVAPGGGPNTPTSVRLARRNILSLLSSGMRDSELPFAVGDDYLRLAGTSMSAPHVTAAVAILRSVRPDLEPAEVRRLIRMSARDLGAPGHDPDFAAGLLDVAALVDTLLPDIDFSVDSPRPGFTHDPAKGALVLRGRADGPDLAWLEVDVGFGLTARSFEPLASFGDSRLELDSADPEPGVLARWDVAEVADGPHVIRLRAHLLDGRVVEEYAIVGIERNAPIRLSEGLLDAAHPALSGRRLFWQVDESEDSKGTHDLAAGLFPRRVGADYGQEPRTRLLFEREGNQREVVADGRELAWLTNAGGVWRIERCRLDAQGRCAPSSVSDAEGTLLTPRVGGGWLVWMRFLGTDRILEGCRIGLDYPICQARPLLDPGAEPGWVLQSFDGRTLLLARGGTLARCSIDPDSSL